MKKLQLLLMFVLSSSMLFAQQRTITGTVNETDGGALPGVNVIVKGTNNGTVTDIDGKYSLNVNEGQNVLVFSYVGYLTEEVDITNRSQVDIALAPDIQNLQEVVVVGYGTQKKVNLTGSVENIKGSDISEQPILQTSQALMGKMAGVTVLQNSSQPGADAATIRIRGIGTLSNSDPLVLIDGVPGDMNGVDPKDIADVSVLKDASAAAIYGSRAANGVVLITTKRGTEEGFQVNYSGYAGWQTPTDFPDYVGGYDYLTNLNLARENLGQDPLYSQQYIDDWQANHVSDPDHYPNTDWINETFTAKGFQQHHHLSISGGNQMAKVLGSISYMDQDGYIPSYNYKRYSARLNTDLTVSPKFSFSFDLNVRRSIRDQPAQGLEQVVRQAYRIPPVYAAQYSDGSWGPGWNGQNPVAIVHAGGINEDQYNYFRGIIKANYKPVQGMNLSVMYAPEYNDRFGNDFTRTYDIYNFDTKDLEYTYPDKSSLTMLNDRALTNNLDVTGTYEKTLGDHFIKALVGYELITYHRDWFNAYRDKFPLEDYPVLSAGASDNMQNSGSSSEWGLQSYFARLNYDYKSKYLLEGNIRMDGSSRFSEGNKYGLFPSFSAGWRVSEEPFFSNVGLINNLKVRASWGQLGNQNVGDSYYPFASTISLGVDYLFGGSPASGAAQTDLANPNISWETTETSNLGIDVGMIQNKLTFSLEYYVRNTKDILLQLPIPMTIGLNAPYQNAGQVRNTGWDLSAGWSDKAGDFDYGINFNLSDVHNEVVDLVGTGPYINNYNIIREGDPINAIYGYQATGFFQNQEEVDNSPAQFGALAPGDIKYANQVTVDSNGDGVPDQTDDVINADDRAIIGNPFPRYTFGLNLYAKFKGFDLTLFFQGVGKRDVFLQGDAVWAFFNAGKMQKWQLDYWTPENPDASYPRLVATTSHNNFETSSFWVYNAAYLRMRNVTLGYTLPQSILNNLFIKDLRVYFSGQNLMTLDKMPKGWDPEAPNGTSGAVYPIAAIYTFGLDLKF